jgi:ribonuclease HI
MKLYTDGSCLNNPGVGGWAAICVDDNDSVKFKICGGDDQATNNIMELTAVIRGLERFGGGSVTVYTDSKYVMDGITKWIHGWKRNDWRTSSGGAVKNKSLWEQLDHLNNPLVNFEWVKAHNGDQWNEQVDTLARETAKLLK